MIGEIFKGLASIFKVGAKTALTKNGTVEFGELLGSLFKNEDAARIFTSTIRGMKRGALVGGGLWAATGNPSWMTLMTGAGAWHGAASTIEAGRIAAGEGPGLGGIMGNVLAPKRMMRNFTIGTGIGLATGNPNWAIYGTFGIPAARWLAKSTFSVKGSARFMKGMLQAPFAPRAAAKTFSELGMGRTFAAGGFVGLVGGAAYATVKGLTWNEPNSITSGYFPGGVMPLGPGGRGISNNHLDTEGLTLALHRTARRTRIM